MRIVVVSAMVTMVRACRQIDLRPYVNGARRPDQRASTSRVAT